MFTKRNPVHETKKEGGGTKLNVTDNDDGRTSARTAETSPLVYARLAGLLLLIVALISASALYMSPPLLLCLEMPQQQPIILGLLGG